MNEQYYLRNISEDLIEVFLDECIKNAKICICDKCRMDVKAYALNHFPSNYVVTHLGDLMKQTKMLSAQYRADIIKAIMMGIRIVKENPKH